MNARGVNLTDGGVTSARNTTSTGTATSAKFSRPAPSEKRALACEQIATSSALNASGTEGTLAAIDATGASTTPAAIGTIDASNVPNLDGSFAATRAAKASAASNATHTDEANVTKILKKASGALNTNHADETGAKDGVNLTDDGAANTKNIKNASVLPCKNELQAELKNELNHAVEQQAELQNKSNSIKSQIGHRSELSHDELQAEHQGKLNRAEQQDKQQSELSCAEQRNEPQSKPCTAEPQDVLILLSLGAFDFPQQCFIRANASGTRYFIRRPLPTRENHAAHQKISEIFSQWQR